MPYVWPHFVNTNLFAQKEKAREGKGREGKGRRRKGMAGGREKGGKMELMVPFVLNWRKFRRMRLSRVWRVVGCEWIVVG